MNLVISAIRALRLERYPMEHGDANRLVWNG
jgi:hypothetical protein